MEYRSTEQGDVTEIFLKGRFVFSDNESFRRIIKDMDNNSSKEWVLNLGELDFIDSAGLGMLLIAREAAEKNCIGLKLRSAQGQVREMLEISQFDGLIAHEA